MNTNPKTFLLQDKSIKQKFDTIGMPFSGLSKDPFLDFLEKRQF